MRIPSVPFRIHQLRKEAAKAGLAMISLAGVLAMSSSAYADTVTFDTTLTTSNPTFNRPISNGGAPPVTTAPDLYYYSAQSFFVSLTGTYTLQTISANLSQGIYAANDTHLELYQNSFDPSSPLTNILASNDDQSAGNSLSLITANLTAGVQYLTIPTTYGSLGTGTITTQISGPGTITLTAAAAPEPGSLALALPVVGMAGMLLRRRRTSIQ